MEINRQYISFQVIYETTEKGKTYMLPKLVNIFIKKSIYSTTGKNYEKKKKKIVFIA